MTVRVPADAEPGDQAGGVVVSLKSQSAQASGPNVVLDQRVATRVYIRVSGNAVPELTIENLSATADAALYPFRAARSTVTYTIRNTGNVAVDYNASASISGVVKAWGEQAPIVDNPDGFPALLPGSSVTVTVEVGNIIPQILMKATAEVQARPAGATDASVAPFVETTRFFAVPWLMVALIGLFLVSVLLRILRRRRRAAAIDDARARDEMVGAAGQ
jgi:hypothetical protein